MIWARCPAALYWCAVDRVDASVQSLCNGRFSAEDYAVNADPPPATRCQRCELLRMRAERISGISAAEWREAADASSSAAGAAREPATFTESEYASNAAAVVAAAAAYGQAFVVRTDGSVRVSITIPTADLQTMPASPPCPVERGLAELARNAP